MADPDGNEALAIKKRLLEKSERFSFFQAYRLLRLIARKEGRTEARLLVRPNLSLNFPGTDLSSISVTPEGTWELTANFLGLYGVTSPLPTYFTEALLDELNEGRHSNRDFLDIISQTIYPLFFRAWLKSRAHLRITEFQDKRLLEILHTFVGINTPQAFRKQPGFDQLLRFAGLFSQYPRSAMGLHTIIAALYPNSKVDVIQQDEMWQPIPTDQHMRLGMQACTLGEDSHVGSMVRSRSNNLTIRIHDVDQETFLSLLPGRREYQKLSFIIRYYLLDPLRVRLDLKLRPGAVQPIRLGAANQQWAALGQDTWLVDTRTPQEARVQVML
jgi:type VI secretion protein, VC_A0111 family